MGRSSQARLRRRRLRRDFASAFAKSPPPDDAPAPLGPVRMGPVVAIGVCIGAGLLAGALMLMGVR